MGYLRSLDENEERRIENERVQLLEREKMKKEAEALARTAVERRKARELLKKKEEGQGGGPALIQVAARTLSKSTATAAAAAAAATPDSSSSASHNSKGRDQDGPPAPAAALVAPAATRPGVAPPRLVPTVKTTTSIRHRVTEMIQHAENVLAMEEAQAMAVATAGAQ